MMHQFHLHSVEARTAPVSQVVDLLTVNGGVIVRNLIDQDTLAQVSRDVTPHFDKFWEGGIFTSKSRVVTGLAAKSTAFIEHIACNPLFLEVCDRLLASTYTCWYGEEQVTFTSAPQINAAIAISNSPGNEAQKLHRDDMGLHHTLPGITPEAYTPGRDVGVGLFVAATRTTKENGATRFIPGSHLWDTSHRPDEGLTVPVELQPGDAFIMLASCFHAGSANVSQEDRTIYSTFLTKGFLRQEENQYLTVNKEQLKKYPSAVAKRLGFTPSDPFHGWVDLKNPLEALGLEDSSKVNV